MTEHTITVTAADAEKLRQLISEAQRTGYRGSPYLQMLWHELERAEIVDEQDLRPDVITMHSQAELVDANTGEEMVLTLVYPDEADPLEGKISILAPIGTAMLGYREGDEFNWDTPDGNRTLRVTKVITQPERQA